MTAQKSSESLSIGTAHRQFTVGGRPFVVRGIHYGPWRPGTGPNKHYPFPKLEHVANDFEMIRGTHANTVLIYDAPPEVLDLAEQHSLKVVYVFALDWWSIGGPNQSQMTSQIVERVKALRAKPALFAWILGNEVGGQILQERGTEPIISGLKELYAAVKAADSQHPISHANWPPARHLDLAFLDFVSFNVYPLWPPEVVAAGFGRYIETTLRPIAGERPLLISEFGVNTTEASEDGQSRLLRSSWIDLLGAGAAGGIVFEFADEWWKNYNNPVRPGDWWTRVPAQDDEVRHDIDPEENYGLVRADRTAKPAFAVVAEFFGEPQNYRPARTAGLITLLMLVIAAVIVWAWAHRNQQRRSAS